ncbi:calcium-binding protein [Algirhabdus cladophorae]|uniref:calcium-binding protein n=1 Tax=Algirhabdus cladophorae TaxID=3377108 RepID=UPI003B8472EA
MASFTFIGTYAGTHSSQVTGISDVQIRDVSGAWFAYVTSQANGLITAYQITSGGGFNFIDQEVFSTQGTPYGLQFLDIGTGMNAVALGTSTTVFSAMGVSGNGTLQTDTSFDAATSGLGNFKAAISFQINGGSYVYGAREDTSGFELFKLDSSDDLQVHPAGALDGDSQTRDVGAFATVSLSNQSFLYATSQEDQEIVVYQIKPNGVPKLLTSVGIEQNLGIATPRHLEQVQVDGMNFLVLGSSGSSSITIFEVLDDGTLRTTDHVFDELTTRFQNLPAMEVATVGERAFVVVGGADDGLTILELMPDGTLLHRDTIADQTYSALDGVSGIDAYVDGTEIHIYAAGQNDVGVSHFVYDVGNTGLVEQGSFTADTLIGSSNRDLLSGGSGNDVISGLGGSDTLVDGSGQDVLTGGAGSDLFVLSNDNDFDVITDFEVGIDRLDLSNYQLFRNTDQLDIASHGDGATLTFFGESLRIYTSNGQSLTQSDIEGMDVISLTHMTIGLTPQDLVLTGGGQADALVGGLGNDTLLGQNGNDILRGNGGADLLQGGDGEDCADYSAAFVGITVDMKDMAKNTGEAQGDLFESVEHILGSDFRDRLFGDGSHNDLMGERGNDSLQGRGGNDAIRGGKGNDTISGNSGRDDLRGGNGRDHLSGNSGQDIITGGNGADTLSGGKGNDVLTGGSGEDVFIFSEDKDTITDLVNNRDTILIDGNLLSDAQMSGEMIVDTYATVHGDTTVFDFGGGHELTLLNVTDLSKLYNDVDVM